MNMHKLACPACNNEEMTYVYKKLQAKRGLLKCDFCGLSFVWPKPIFNEHVYSKEYYEAWSLKELGHEGLVKMKHATFDRLFDIISRYKNSGSLLDIGCAFGHLLDVAKRRGWDGYGIEVSEFSANEAKNKIGRDRIFVGDFLALEIPKDKFDVITMVDIIEHTYDISGVFNKCKEWLKNNGLLVIVTPDTGSLSHRFLRKYWPHFNEQHVTFLSRRCAEKIIVINGFRLLEILKFKKALNLYYLTSVVCAHSRKFLIPLIKLVRILMPAYIKRINFFVLQGEILIISQKQ